MPRETEKHSLMMIGGKQNGGQCLGGRNQDGSGTRKSGDFFQSQDFAPTWWQPLCVRRGCSHTPCRTHIFLTHFPCVTSKHRVHAFLKVLAVRMPYLLISPSPFSSPHPPSLLFPHGHFDISFPSAPSLPNCFRSESAGHAHERRGVWLPGR